MSSDDTQSASGQERESAAASADFYRLDETLSEREIRDRVRRLGEREGLPITNDYWERAEFPSSWSPSSPSWGSPGRPSTGMAVPVSLASPVV